MLLAAITTARETKQNTVFDTVAGRGAYIDQSVSLNIHMTDTTTDADTLLCYSGTGIAQGDGILQSYKYSDDVEAAFTWRLEEGHAVKHEFDGKSLVSRICSLDPTVSTAAVQFMSFRLSRNT